MVIGFPDAGAAAGAEAVMPPETSLPLLKLYQRPYEFILAEIGPIHVGHDQFGVGHLIEEEVQTSDARRLAGSAYRGRVNSPV